MSRVFVDPDHEDGLMIFVGSKDEEWGTERCVRLWRNGKITHGKRTLTQEEAQKLKPPYPEDLADLRRFLTTGSWE